MAVDYESIRRRIAEDREAGLERGLEEYLRSFPGHDVLVGRAFVDVNEVTGDGSAGSSREGWFGPYRVVEELGRGGQGVVYLAEDTRLGRQVALKVLTALGPESADTLQRFRREAQVGSRLEHPGICSIYEAGVANGVPYIAMQHVPGQPLSRWLSSAAAFASTGDSASTLSLPDPASADLPSEGGLRFRPAPRPRRDLRRILGIFEKVARALHAAHEAGIVHRDIKPGNIMVTPKGDPVILDFGFARLATSDHATLTQSGDVFGTPSYMSPEQLREGSLRVDHRTDVYSLGVTLFECLTLRRPFEAPTAQALYQAILRDDPPGICTLNPDVPRPLEIVLEAALEKDLDRRYRSAEAFADDLRRILDDESIHAVAAGPFLKLRRWSRRRPALAAALLSAFLLLSVGLIVTAWFLGQTRAALEREERARRDADRQRARADDNLAAYERVSDEFRLQRLIGESRDRLWPAEPGRIPEMDAWLARARRLAALLPSLRADLASLRERALPLSEATRTRELAARAPERRRLAEHERMLGLLISFRALLDDDTSVEARDQRRQLDERHRRVTAKRDALLEALSHRRTHDFADDRDAWRHERLAAFTRALTRFVEGSRHGDTIASVRARRNFAATIEERSVTEHAAEWDEAIASIADDPVYSGLRIRPQIGLVPLGPDPESGLQEFCDLQTGTVPERDERSERLRLEDGSGIVFVLIPGGKFLMGSQKESPERPNYDPRTDTWDIPAHEVELDPFFLSKYEMTQGQWLRVTDRNPSQYRQGALRASLRSPVEQVSWTEADAVLGRLGLLLPTEAQWEYGCRGGTSTPWWTGAKKHSLAGAANIADAAARRNGSPWASIDDWPELDDGYPVHAPVGRFRPNPFGLHDVHGNVWEWCLDHQHGYTVPVRPGDGFRGVEPARYRVLRGSSFTGTADDTRSSRRYNGTEDARIHDIGLRPARSLEP